MTHSELNTFMAEKVLSFVFTPNNGEDYATGASKSGGWYIGCNPVYENDVDWNPCANIEQAMMCLDKMDNFQICKAEDDYIVYVWPDERKDDRYSAECGLIENIPLAICSAIYEAMK